MAGNVMIRNCNDGYYLLAVYLGRSRSVSPLLFVSKSSECLTFDNEEEAQATIDFISNVIDFETAEQLEIIVIPEVNHNV